MQGGTGALTVGRAIFATAPGAAHPHPPVRQPAGEGPARGGVDGAQPKPEPDRIAFFTQNQNSSKVDIFQTRQVIHDVYLQENGSASVVQTAKVTNNAPAEGGSPWRTASDTPLRWAFHWNVVLLPEGARRREDRGPTPARSNRRPRSLTWTAARPCGWVAGSPARAATSPFRTTLPDGTFGTDGNLDYRASVEHQLTIKPVDLTVNVTGPSQPEPREGAWVVTNDRASTRFPVTEPTTIALEFRSR